MNTYTITTGQAYGQAMGEDGPYTVTRFVVEAVSPEGVAYWHEQLFEREADALRLAARVIKHIKSNPTWEPEEHWVFNRRIYGSIAYQNNRMDEEHYSQRLDVEAEYGPGSYLPGHPGYLRNV